MVLMASAIFSQTAMTLANGYALDTVTNAATKTATTQVKDYQETVAMVVSITKISGTVGGTATPQGSLDGVNYVGLATASTITDVAAQSFAYAAEKSKYRYYRWSVTGTGTMVVSFSAKILARKAK
jgi:hypothetical protein